MDETAGKKIIDWSLLMDVCGYEDMVKKVIRLSLADAGETMMLLGKGINGGNSKNIALYAHRLRGVAMTMGASSLSQVAYDLECAGEEKDMPKAVLLIEQVKDEFEKVRRFLSEDGWIEKAKKQNIETERQLI